MNEVKEDLRSMCK